MANDFSGNPWVIDTPYALNDPVSNPPGHITRSLLRITSIVWTDQVAAGDQAVITQVNGKPLMDNKTSAPNTAIVLGNPQWVRGLLVPILASGKLTIQHGK